MESKIFLLFFYIGLINCAGLLKKPKVYNAVITTDENLTPSRAFPVIQPTIHETGIATYPFHPFNPYRIFSPHWPHYGQPSNQIYQRIPGPFPKELQLPIQQPPQRLDIDLNPHFSAEHNEFRIPNFIPKDNRDIPHFGTNERPPIPLNEYGLPPNLIPIQTVPRREQAVNLQPYTFNHYPLIYDPLSHYQEQYLPHFGYYPQSGFINKAIDSKKEENEIKDKNIKKKIDNSFDKIKNDADSKSNEVPDVPPPPLPAKVKNTAE